MCARKVLKEVPLDFVCQSRLLAVHSKYQSTGIVSASLDISSWVLFVHHFVESMKFSPMANANAKKVSIESETSVESVL